MVARLTPDQKAACSNHVGVSLYFVLTSISIEKNVKAILKSVEIMKQLIKINEKCCCDESFFLSPLYALAVLKSIDEVKGAGDGRGEG